MNHNNPEVSSTNFRINRKGYVYRLNQESESPTRLGHITAEFPIRVSFTDNSKGTHTFDVHEFSELTSLIQLWIDPPKNHLPIADHFFVQHDDGFPTRCTECDSNFIAIDAIAYMINGEVQHVNLTPGNDSWCNECGSGEVE